MLLTHFLQANLHTAESTYKLVIPVRNGQSEHLQNWDTLSKMGGGGDKHYVPHANFGHAISSLMVFLNLYRQILGAYLKLSKNNSESFPNHPSLIQSTVCSWLHFAMADSAQAYMYVCVDDFSHPLLAG
jgi:hypothetical protein